MRLSRLALSTLGLSLLGACLEPSGRPNFGVGDTTPPTVLFTSVDPRANGGVPIVGTTDNLEITFSEQIDRASLPDAIVVVRRGGEEVESELGIPDTDVAPPAQSGGVELADAPQTIVVLRPTDFRLRLPDGGRDPVQLSTDGGVPIPLVPNEEYVLLIRTLITDTEGNALERQPDGGEPQRRFRTAAQ